MKGRAGTHQGVMSTTSSGHAAVQRAHEPSKEGCRGIRPERTTPGGSSRAGRGRQYCKLHWLLSPPPEFSKCIFELKPPRQCRMQRRFREDSGVLALFCEPESPESSPRIFLSGLYVLHSQWEWRIFRKFRDYFTIFFCWNLRNRPAESSSKTFASCTAPRPVIWQRFTSTNSCVMSHH